MKLSKTQKAQIVALFVQIARGYIGISRANNQAQVTKFLNLFGLDFRDENGKLNPFCASGLMYAWCKAVASVMNIKYTDETAVAVFRHQCLPIIAANWLTPSPSCHCIKDSAKANGLWRRVDGNPAVDEPTPCFVLYSWNGKHDPDGGLYVQHIGMLPIDHNEDDGVILDVEFNVSDADNVNGGSVAQKERSIRNIAGYIPLLAE